MSAKSHRHLEVVLNEDFERLLALPAQLHRLAEELAALQRSHDATQSVLQGLCNDCAALKDMLRELCVREDTLIHASQQQALLTDDHYQRHVIEPVARALISLIDSVDDQRKAADLNGSRDLLAGLRASMESLLAHFGIEAIEVKAGLRFDARSMKPIATHVPLNASQSRTVKEVRQAGFRRGERVLRPARVVVYE